GDAIPDSVRKLLELARDHGRSAYFVPTMGFDDVMTRLARFCLTPAQRRQYEAILSKATETARISRSAFTIAPAPIAGIIKSNAFEITIPTEVLTLEVQHWPAEKPWEWVTQKARNHGFVAVPYRKKLPSIDTPGGSDGYLRRVLAFGLADDVRS